MKTDPLTVPTSATGQHILVIDDEPSIADAAARMLVALGYRCTVADGVVSAYEILVSPEPLDAVLCDFRLKDRTATELVDKMASVRPELLRRVVISTGAANDARLIDLVARTGATLLLKPFSLAELREALSNCIASATSRA